MDIEKTINDMTLEEKANLLCGYQNMKTYPVKRLGIPSLSLSDGPNGLRIENSDGDSLSGIDNTLKSTCFPSGVNLASSFDSSLLEEVGDAIGKEALSFGVNVVLGPAINIKRNPLCGRNFEYFSEDPLLSGTMAVSYVHGVQKNGVGCCLKHFACNNNEKYRFVGDSIVDERALHEIYLKPFEIAVKKASPYAIMTAYNKVNSIHCSENSYLQEEILRGKWGFDGLSITDWGGIIARDRGLLAGTDLEMPGQVHHSVSLIMDGVKNGSIPQEKVDQSVRRILTAIEKTKSEKKDADFKKNYELAVKAVEESAVLLKNERELLPLKKGGHYLVIGDFFDKIRYQGSGSALLNPYELHSHREIFDQMKVDYEFVKGFKEEETEIDESLEKEALEKAKSFDGTILFFGGLNDYVESEGFDRENLRMPENQLSLLTKLAGMNKDAVLVLHNGSVISEDVLDDIPSILDLLLPGEGGALGCYHLLFGETSPSGKLAETWVRDYEDVPFHADFTRTKQEVYKESVMVGYRHYLRKPERIRFPFGYGLSYSNFECSDLEIREETDSLLVSVRITNTGSFDGKEVLQIYSCHASSLMEPERTLVGFKKVFLKEGESQTVSIQVMKENLKVFDTKRNDFVLEQGDYTFFAGFDSLHTPLSSSLTLSGERIEASYPSSLKERYEARDLNSISDEDFGKILGHEIPAEEKSSIITMETPLGEFDKGFAKFFAHAVRNVGWHKYQKACKMKDGIEKERKKKAGLFVYRLMPNNCLRSLCYSSSGAFSYPLSQGILLMCNHHFFKGLFRIMKKDK